jgi:hypothetical protein
MHTSLSPKPMCFIKMVIFSCVKNAFLVFENTLKFLDGKSCAYSNHNPQHKKDKKITTTDHNKK